MTKGEIRITQKKLRSELSEEQRRQFDECILHQLKNTKEYLSCKRLFVYVSFQSEINTIDIIDQAILHGKQVYIPRVEAHGIEFYEITSRKGLVRSTYGILEPAEDKENRFLSTPGSERKENVMLLPGLAFDSYGNRIGYGAGYYDKYLEIQGAEIFHKLALAYDFQIMEQIPSEEFDIRADEIITPTRIYRCINKSDQ